MPVDRCPICWAPSCCHAVVTWSCFLLEGVLPNLFKLAPAAGISWFTFEVRN